MRLLLAILSLCLLKVFAGFGPETVENESGYIAVHNGTRHLFYWFFESRSNPSTDPLMIWMTGGPGCSGLVALFEENGPYIIADDLSLSLRKQSWNSLANVIWIDQPVGTGFSFDSQASDIGVVSEVEMAQDMYEFLQGFLKLHPQFQPNPFFLFGESYAGHYLPAFGARIVQGNVNKDGVHVNLNGVGIGNGLVSPLHQYPAYADYAQDYGIVDSSASVIMHAMLPVCVDMIKACDNNNGTVGWLACYNAYIVCNYAEIMPVEFTGINYYDIRIKCAKPPLCYDFDNVQSFLDQPYVLAGLNIDPQHLHSWKSCKTLVEEKLVLAGDWMKDFEMDIPYLLSANVSILVYEGMTDFIVNYYGAIRWTESMEWPGANAYANAKNATWTVDGQSSGFIKQADGLTLLLIEEAGHMSPRDQPDRVLSMVRSFVQGLPFSN